jgi:hypothetical protein
MRRLAIGPLVLIVLATIAEAYLAAAEPSVRDISLRAYVFAVGGLAMLVVLSAATHTLPRLRRSIFEAALARRAPPARPVSQLERLQRDVVLATETEWDLHRRLLPELREIAEGRLARGAEQPGPDTLGRWWELLRPDRPAPTDRRARGIDPAELRALVADLERLP